MHRHRGTIHLGDLTAWPSTLGPLGRLTRTGRNSCRMANRGSPLSYLVRCSAKSPRAPSAEESGRMGKAAPPRRAQHCAPRLSAPETIRPARGMAGGVTRQLNRPCSNVLRGPLAEPDDPTPPPRDGVELGCGLSGGPARGGSYQLGQRIGKWPRERMAGTPNVFGTGRTTHPQRGTNLLIRLTRGKHPTLQKRHFSLGISCTYTSVTS